MFERIDYTVERIDGDYAYLKRVDEPGSRLVYEMLQYTLL